MLRTGVSLQLQEMMFIMRMLGLQKDVRLCISKGEDVCKCECVCMCVGVQENLCPLMCTLFFRICLSCFLCKRNSER